jgi:hypothetical protein
MSGPMSVDALVLVRDTSPWMPGGVRGATCWLRRTAVGFLATVATVLVWRRLAGALTVSPSPGATVFAGGALALAAFVGHRFVENSKLHAVIAALVLVAAAALSIPGTTAVPLVALWGLVLGVEASTAFDLLRRSEPRNGAAVRLPLRGAERTISQQITRYDAVDGADVLEAELFAVLAPGERHAAIHVAFCPPFAVLPTVDCEQTDGPEAQLRIGQLLHQGVRIDVRLASAGPANIGVALVARVEAEPSER